ncbi:MAG: hypothetical protein RQ761_08520 [Bacteroidales bacterium]|nr:hypothetical protein [Bacteroidales bacterium]
MKRYLTIILAVCHILTYAQNNKGIDIPSGLRNTGPLSLQDEIVLNSIEEVVLPGEYRFKSLPDSIDNSKYVWFRPIFSQEVYPNCMQSTSIAYNFTYEINRLRDLPADTSDNQYTTHFAWNFFNGGSGWYGANYLYTMDVLKYHGTPSVTDYGGMYYGGGERWMTGYDKWKNAMNNRIAGVRQIYVGNEEGLLTLKHWLNDHLDGSSTGGVASFIACSPYGLEHLPPGTPNAGKAVVTHFCNQASHGMTIVGFNDSIRYDYNNDGQYTNNIDLNGDGRITMSDWEMGGVLMANSHGLQFGDDGYAYMMYKTLADDINDGGIWANRVHILDVKEEHHTRMTFKVALEHDYRGRIKVSAGISADVNANKPEHNLEYTIFNYQGGWHYMQGNDTTAEHKTIEFGLDVTPLLSFVEPGAPCKFFLIVDERDKENLGSGQLKYFSVIDHQNGDIEIPCEQQNVPLIENGSTILPVVYQAPSETLEITPVQLPAYEAGVPMEVQLNAQGGDQPYIWTINRNYNMNRTTAGFPEFQENLILPNSYNDTMAIQVLDFSFPFYGNYFDTVAVSSSGYLQFDENMFFWSYLVDLPYFLKNKRVIAPFLCPGMMVHDMYENGIWYEGDATKASFRWKTTLAEQPGSSVFNFALSLYPNGNIDFYYGEMIVEDDMRFISGIADGDLINFSLPEMPYPAEINPDTKIEFINGEYPEGLSMTDHGLLSIQQNTSNTVTDVQVIVTDNTLLSSAKTYQLTDGLGLQLEIAGTHPGMISYGQLSYINLYAVNRGSHTLSNIELSLSCDHPLLEITSGNINIGNLLPGESMELTDAFSCLPGVDISDRDLITFHLDCDADEYNLMRNYFFFSSSPVIELHKHFVDSENGILDPGEATDISISLYNDGSRKSINTSGILYCEDTRITLNDTVPVNFGTMLPGSYATAYFNLTADHSIPYGSKIDFSLEIKDEIGLTSILPLSMRVGKTPVCIVDMDPAQSSGPGIHALLNQMNVENNYEQSFPHALNNYQSVFLCLGKHFSYHEITYQQSTVLMEYLDQGGNLYMEGRVVWEQDEQWPIFDRFKLETTSAPSLYEVLSGVDSTFTEGLAYENTAVPAFNYYYLGPVYPAYGILEGGENLYCAAVAYDGGTYKTIGTIFEIGALSSSDTCTVEQYMQGVLDFFGVLQSSLGIEDAPEEMPYRALQNFPNPFTHATKIPLELHEKSFVEAAVYDLNGRKVHILAGPSWMGKGKYYLRWNGDDQSGKSAPGGIYIYRVVIDGIPFTGKMVLMK